MDFVCTSGMYYGIKQYWNYDHQRSVYLSMKNYVLNALYEFQHYIQKDPNMHHTNENVQTVKQKQDGPKRKFY